MIGCAGGVTCRSNTDLSENERRRRKKQTANEQSPVRADTALTKRASIPIVFTFHYRSHRAIAEHIRRSSLFALKSAKCRVSLSMAHFFVVVVVVAADVSYFGQT